MVDVVVVDYRTHEDLQGFLESFDACHADEDRLHIVLVDPTTPSTAVAATWAKHPAHAATVTFDSNVGYGLACNTGALGGRADVIGFFNADTRLAPGVTATCAAALREHDDWGIVGPRQVDDYGRLTHAGIFGTNITPNFRGAWLSHDRGQCDDVRDDCVSISGSAYFVKRSLWEELTGCPLYQQACRDHDLPGRGAFLESPLYFEDMWCSVHARHHGHKVTYLGTTVMTHRWHKAVEAAGHGEPTAKYRAALELYRYMCDQHHIDHE